MKKKNFSLILLAISIFSAVNIFAESNKTIAVTKANDIIGVHIVDNEHYNEAEQSYDRVNFNQDSEPFIDESDRVQIPVRAIAEALNFEVLWDGSEQKITLTKDQNTVILHLNDTTISVNDIKKQMDTTPLLKNDRTFIPLRFIGEAFGYEIDYSEAQNPNSISANVD